MVYNTFMRIHVSTIGSLALQCKNEASVGTITIPEGLCAKDVLKSLGINTDFPLVVIINDEIKTKNTLLNDNDTIKFVPFVSGG